MVGVCVCMQWGGEIIEGHDEIYVMLKPDGLLMSSEQLCWPLHKGVDTKVRETEISQTNL